MKKVGVRDVAKEANVSPTTVSRVLNNRGYLSDEVKQKVYAAMEKLEYVPNELARALYKNKTNTVGLIFPTITNPFHAELIQDIEFHLSANGYKVFLCNSLNNPEKEREYLTMLRKNQVDGIIVGTHNQNIEDYNIPGLPIVAIDRNLGEGTTTISCDNYAGGKMAVELLLSQKCKNILCIRGDSKIKLPANSRTLAYLDMMKKAKLPESVLEVQFIKSIPEKRKLVEDYLFAHPEIDGIFAGDDLLATFAIETFKKMGKTIPQEAKVIGFDGAEQTLAYKPELTTIQQPIQAISQLAVEVLLKKIAGEKTEDVLDLPVSLIRGATV